MSKEGLEWRFWNAFSKVPRLVSELFEKEERPTTSESNQQLIVEQLQRRLASIDEKAFPTHLAPTITRNISIEKRKSEWLRLFSTSCDPNGIPLIADISQELAHDSKFWENVNLLEKDVIRLEQSNEEFAVTSPVTLSRSSLVSFSCDNEHITSIRRILLSWIQFHRISDPIPVDCHSYCQGMGDVCWVFYSLFRSEHEALQCFAGFMALREKYFAKNSPEMAFDLRALRKLVELFHPGLYRFLSGAGCLNMFFCYRWVYLLFKREHFDTASDLYELWEICLFRANRKFHLFVVLAICLEADELLSRSESEAESVIEYYNRLEKNWGLLVQRAALLEWKFSHLREFLLDPDLKELLQ